ncbi:SRPBCC domain-containing protein [Bacillus timonensis]|nr:SRPBCC domain-containing protein [Bacillus timonensis]
MEKRDFVNVDDAALVMTNVFDAPIEKVFAMWTEEQHLGNWWSPKGFSIEISKLECKPGGVFHYKQTTPDGFAMWGRFEYREVRQPNKLVYINSFSDEEGNVVRAPFSSTFPLQIENTLIFTEEEGGTKLVMSGVPFQATDEEREAFKGMHDAIRQGFAGTFEQLQAYLSK